jgi:dihydroorotase
MFDMLIKGGHVIDPASGVDGRMDIALKRSRIAAVDKNIPLNSALEVIDATNQYVSPGFIDLHSHVYTGVTFWGIDADSLASHTGVTTWIDAGSAGAYTLSGFRDLIIKPSSVRIYSMLNISTIGLVPSNYELTRIEWCNVDLLRKIANKNRDIVLGIKVRMGIPMAGELGIEPLIRARLAADKCELPIMVHIAWAPPALKEVIARMKPGDILTHCFTGLSMRIVDEKRCIFDFVKRAWDNGIVMDIAHGVLLRRLLSPVICQMCYQPMFIR